MVVLPNFLLTTSKPNFTRNAYCEPQAALKLAEVPGEQEALEHADALTRLVPQSWLRREFEKTDARTVLAQLSSTQWKVMRAVIEGLSTRQIAALRAQYEHDPQPNAPRLPNPGRV